ncbi:hypothetical protein HF086_007293 [Spodoptera exigua]|uniref:Fucosyltransferase n=1 Tax=Spodoptera exigua TaxID=7107 RepID=A0A922MQ09_SPOEX|nr:hypothetical protein HF086_007293 [Spodoptera exigua]
MVNRKLLIGFVIITIVILYTFVYDLSYFKEVRDFYELTQTNVSFKYILVWTSLKTDPLFNLRVARDAFIERACPITNCFVTGNRELLHDITKFDVIVFHAPEFVQKGVQSLPAQRKPHQKYIFTSMESAAYYPICNQKFLNFFNWTWTYKLNSDLNYAYFSVWNKNGSVIGPKEEMHWMKVEDMAPVNDTLKEILNGKTIAAAWFVSNCGAPSGRDKIAKQLQIELQTHGLRLDIYGSCGTMKCPKSSMDECMLKLRSDYYFYLSFENSFSDDYVTEKLLNALDNYAVPVVFGGANYTRFMPDGIYLSANTLTIKELAKKMADSIKNKELYYEYFKWHNHYSYRDVVASVETDPYCKLCEAINNEEEMSKTTIYEDIGMWFMPDGTYLSANTLTIKELAKKMADIIKNKELYYEYFKWHNHYSYRDVVASVETDPYCKLCEAINNEEEMSKTTIYEDIGMWWSPKKCQFKNNRFLNKHLA